MIYENAIALLAEQDRALSKIKNIRLFEDGYEYRIDYRGGLASYIAIDRRRIGNRKFKFFSGVTAAHCADEKQAMALVKEEIKQEK